MDQDVTAEEAADPAAAFEALRREVALLRAAVAGLIADRISAPDYSETLGEIAQGVGVAIARLGKLATSPALALSPAQMAREISQAGEAVRQQDRAALHQARDNLQQAERELQGWIITARLAERQNWRLVQLAALGFIGGVVLGASLPTIVVQAAPERWAWPEKRAAHMLGRDMAAAGERLLAIADPQRWGEMQSAWAIVDDNRAVIARCRQTADKTGKPSRCAIVLTPAGAQTGLPSDPRLDQVPAVKRRLPASDGRSSTAGSPASWTAETCLVPQGKGSPSLVCAYRLPTRPPRLSFSIRDHDASNKDPSDPIRKATLGPLTDGRAFSTANRDLWTPSKLCSKENWL